MNNSPQPISNTTNQNTFSVDNLKTESKQKIFTQKTKTADAIIADVNPQSISDSRKTKNEIKKETALAAESSESPEAEPANANADILATGEFADQVNLTIENSDCKESCADNTDVNIPAVGEFADQINADVVFNQAMLDNPDLQPEVQLAETPVNSDPPTEFGAYTPEPQ